MSDYRLPNPAVFQVLNRVSQDLANADLAECIVGTLYQVVKASPIVVTLPFVTPTTVSYPGLKVGAIPEASSVVIKVTGGKVTVKSATTHAGIFLVGKTLVTSANNDFANAQSGDVISIANNGGDYIIDKVIDPKNVTVTSPINYAATDAFTITRTYAEYTLVQSACFTANNFGVNITAIKDANNNSFTSGIVSISYRAQRKDLLGIYEVSNPDQLALDMDIDILNPLGYYLNNIALAANGGKKVLAAIPENNSDAAFIATITDLSTRMDAYYIVPLSTSQAVLNAASAHAVAMSDPYISYFRSAILNAPLNLSVVVSSGTHVKA